MNSFKNYKNRLYVGVATGVVSLSLTAMGSSESRAQSAAPQALPPVSIDAPRQRPQATRTVRSRGTPQRSARVAPRQSTERPPASVTATTMGTTHTIGTPAPAYAGGQVAQGGTLGLLGNVSVMNAPFSVQNYTSKLIEDQQARTVGDVLQNDASVRTTNNGNGGYDDTFQIRGFQVDGADVGLNGMYGLVSRFRVPAYITERVQLLKGPAALLNGIAPNNTIGGSINIVTKRAPEDPLLRVTPFFVSAANFGLHVDTARRYGDQKEWGVRFNGVVRDGEAEYEGRQSAQRSRRAGRRLSRRTLPLDRRRHLAERRHQRIPPADHHPCHCSPSCRARRTPGPTGTRDRSSSSATTPSCRRRNIDVTDWLTAYAGVGYRDGFSAQDFPTGNLTNPTTGAFTVTQRYYDEYQKVASGNVGFRSNFNTGPSTTGSTWPIRPSTASLVSASQRTRPPSHRTSTIRRRFPRSRWRA